MRQNILRVLIAAIIVLVLALAWLWLDPRGKPRNVHWQAPEPHKPDFASMIPPLPQQDPADLNRFVSILERPLFSPSRRPPPPPPPPVIAPPPPPPDPLASIHLFGTFSGSEGGGGIIARIDGKPKRVRVNENIGAWVVQSVSSRNVTLTRGGETRTLTLVHARAPVAAAAPVPVTARSSGPNPEAAANVAAPPAAPVAATPPPPAAPLSSDLGERVRERKARINAQRAQSGLPPIP